MYVCPGETAAIPRAVHLGRLAAFWPRCRDCPLRHDHAGLPAATVARWETIAEAAAPCDLWTDDGLAGTRGERVDRAAVAAFAAALAGAVWERSEPGRRPAVLLATDERPHTPPLSDAAAVALRTAGCDVVDLGPATGPLFRFATETTDADAGLHLTAADRPPTHAGLVVCDAAGDPPAANFLADVRARFGAGSPRPTRRGGADRTTDAAARYDAALWRAFDGFSARTALVASASSQLPARVRRLAEVLPNPPHAVALPVRARPPGTAPSADDARRIAEAVRERHADFALLAGEDGEWCVVFDANGAPRPWPAVVAHLAADPSTLGGTAGGSTEAGGTAVLTAPLAASLALPLTAHGLRTVTAAPRDLPRTARDRGAVFAADHHGRVRLDTHPDALRTLAALLRCGLPP